MATTESRRQHLLVSTPQGAAGVLAREGNRYLFTYDAEATPECEVSLTMPLRSSQYALGELHPVFQMNLPEGYVLEQLRQRFAKAAKFDPMLLLAMTGSEAPIGRLRVHADDDPALASGLGERLDTVLAWKGAGDLFGVLAERYLHRTGASGVQPKLLVPEGDGITAAGKVSVTTGELIVKAGGDAYPHLAVNEYLCMEMARQAGIPVPEFHLSDNRQLFVMRRFDRTATGQALGFEDYAVLMGRSAEDKYRGSYEQLARFVTLFCDAESRAPALAQLFDQVALSCMLGNGDAHLKNFGVVYLHPQACSVSAAPAYDIINTTCYLPEDSLALTLGGTKSLFASRLHLLEFGERHCAVADPRTRLRELVAAADEVLAREQQLLRSAGKLGQALEASLAPFRATFAP